MEAHQLFVTDLLPTVQFRTVEAFNSGFATAALTTLRRNRLVSWK